MSLFRRRPAVETTAPDLGASWSGSRRSPTVLEFDVHGSTHDEIDARAREIAADYFGPDRELYVTVASTSIAASSADGSVRAYVAQCRARAVGPPPPPAPPRPNRPTS